MESKVLKTENHQNFEEETKGARRGTDAYLNESGTIEKFLQDSALQEGELRKEETFNRVKV